MEQITRPKWNNHKTELHYVKQVEPFGCAIACIAMVMGSSYKQVKDMLPQDRGYGTRNGMTNEDYKSFLFNHGYIGITLYACEPFSQRIRPRNEWLIPVAPIHIVSVINEHGPHAIVWRQGKVFDPNKDGVFTISDYNNVQAVTGLYDKEWHNGGE